MNLFLTGADTPSSEKGPAAMRQTLCLIGNRTGMSGFLMYYFVLFLEMISNATAPRRTTPLTTF